MDYTELAVTSNFSFLKGASQPQELVLAAALLGLKGIGIADCNTLAGVVRAHSARKEIKKEQGLSIDLYIGCRLSFTDGTPDLVVYPRDRPAYGHLCQILSVGKHRAKTKGECHLLFEDFLFKADNFQIAVMPPENPDESFTDFLKKLAFAAPDCVWVGLVMPREGSRQASR